MGLLKRKERTEEEIILTSYKRKTCEICGKPFIYRVNANEKYCSEECRNEAKRRSYRKHYYKDVERSRASARIRNRKHYNKYLKKHNSQQIQEA